MDFEECAEGLRQYIQIPWPTKALRYGRNLHLWAVGDFRMVPENECLAHLFKGYESGDPGAAMFPYPWGGSIVLTTYLELPSPESPEIFGSYEVTQDITLADPRHAMEYFSRDNKIFESDEPNRFVLRDKSEWLKAVMMSCSGDEKFLGMKKHRKVSIRRDNQVFFSRDISTISQQMGIPLLIQRFARHPSWADKVSRDMGWDPYSNVQPYGLMLSAETLWR